MAALSRNLLLEDKIKADRNSMSDARVSNPPSGILSLTRNFFSCYHLEIISVYFLWLIGQVKMRNMQDKHPSPYAFYLISVACCVRTLPLSLP